MLLWDLGVFSDQQRNERAQQRFTSLADEIHKRKDTERSSVAFIPDWWSLHMGVIKAPLCNRLYSLPPDFGNQSVASNNRCIAIHQFLSHSSGLDRIHFVESLTLSRVAKPPKACP